MSLNYLPTKLHQNLSIFPAKEQYQSYLEGVNMSFIQI